MNYIESQINTVIEHANNNKNLIEEGFKPSLQISFDGVKTKNLGITLEQVEAILQILTD